MDRGKLTLHRHDGRPCGEIDVRLKFDVPEEMMDALIRKICRSVEEWQDSVIAYWKQ